MMKVAGAIVGIILLGLVVSNVVEANSERPGFTARDSVEQEVAKPTSAELDRIADELTSRPAPKTAAEQAVMMYEIATGWTVPDGDDFYEAALAMGRFAQDEIKTCDDYVALLVAADRQGDPQALDYTVFALQQYGGPRLADLMFTCGS